MTVAIRRDAEIYDTEGGWFRARWHFSFDHYVDPENDSFGALRVFNDDRLIPGAVWPLHPHRDVEGVTYVVEGMFGHEDNVGGPFGPLPAGSVQIMTLGSGALHSELNASKDEPMRFIQIWILPDTGGLVPGVEQRVFTTEDRTNRLLKVIGPEGGDVVMIHQDASVHVARLEPGHDVRHPIGEGRGVYAYLIDGAATFDGRGSRARVTRPRSPASPRSPSVPTRHQSSSSSTSRCDSSPSGSGPDEPDGEGRSMCCAVAILFAFGPRAAILVWWLIEPFRWGAAFETFLWPFLGFLVLPWTTLMYVAVFPGGINGFD